MLEKKLDPSSPTRRDGSKKSEEGFLGPIKNYISGGTMTEFSTSMEVDGKEIDIPTMVPTLTYEEIAYLRTLIPGEGFNLKNPIEARIINKAENHALKRLKEGKSPFFQENEERTKKASGDEARSDIDKAIEELTLFGPISEDPLYAISMAVFGPTGKLKLADLASDLAKHSRVKSLRNSGTDGDLAEAKRIYKTIKVKDEGKANELYTNMLNEGKKLASPQDIEKATRNFRRKTEIKKSIESIPLKERLALYTDDTIPLTGKYKALDEDVIDFYDDIIDIQKIPKNYKSGGNSLAKVFLDKKNIPSRVDLDPKLNQLRPRPYYEEIFDFSKNKEKIKLYIPKKDVGGGVKYRTKTINDPSKNEIQKLLDEI